MQRRTLAAGFAASTIASLLHNVNGLSMTAFLSWVGVDHRGPASLYLASDSRISWTDNEVRSWDRGRKVFACSRTPDVLGYVGDVLFPSLVLG